ncbi:MAG: bile acid:sodium symporter family protein [Candidatus Binatia bacterium]|nr:bile acid:sodium symporter family protein [Candidatus Binatia bacterium]
MLQTATNLFPVWVVIGGGLALVHPPLFTWFRGPLIVWGLAVIMLGMGITLSFADFRQVLKVPRPVALGFVSQFLVMPYLAWAIAQALSLDTPFAVGLILTGACPGGTASNVVTYIARANLPLSVLMTMCSTMGAIVLTPLLTKWLAGTMVPVDAWGLFQSTVQVVLLPVLLGITLNHFAPKLVRVVQPASPLIAVVAIVLIVASVIGQSADAILGSGFSLVSAVLLLHSGGFVLGYMLAKFFGYEETIRRTVSIEVGMQNSGLAVVLARSHFANPLTAVPGAISSVVHSVLGSYLAARWRRSE